MFVDKSSVFSNKYPVSVLNIFNTICVALNTSIHYLEFKWMDTINSTCWVCSLRYISDSILIRFDHSDLDNQCDLLMYRWGYDWTDSHVTGLSWITWSGRQTRWPRFDSVGIRGLWLVCLYMLSAVHSHFFICSVLTVRRIFVSMLRTLFTIHLKIVE